MSLLSEFARVTPRHRCPICSRPDWCLLSRDDFDDPALVICAREESRWRWGEAGWLHRRRTHSHTGRQRRSVVLRSGSDYNFTDLHLVLLDAIGDDDVHDLAQRLGLPAEPLRRLGVGLVHPGAHDRIRLRGERPAWSFAMQGADGATVGIHIRTASGFKFCANGSRLGLFVPTGLAHPVETLFVCEGESDTAALLALGLDAVGRPGCRATEKLVSAFVRKHGPREIVVVGDRDGPGREGASALAARVRPQCARVWAVEPPDGVHDVREWIRAGAGKDDVLGLVHHAEPVWLGLSRDGRL